MARQEMPIFSRTFGLRKAVLTKTIIPLVKGGVR